MAGLAGPFDFDVEARVFDDLAINWDDPFFLGVPQDVVATPTGSTTITVTWTTFDGAIGYDIERNGVTIATNHSASPYNDTGLSVSTLYSYRVRAVLPP